MSRNRVYSLREARSDYVPPVRRKEPHPRALVLPNDPPWLHAGLTYRLTYRGELTDLFTVSAVAAALGRSVGTVRRLEAAGIIPFTPLRTPGRGVTARKRLYTREDVFAVAIAALDQEVYLRRPRRWTEPLISS